VSKRSKSAETRDPRKHRGDWTTATRAGTALLWLVLLASAALGLRAADRQARGAAAVNTRIEWVDKPAWLDTESYCAVLEGLENALRIFPDTDIFDSRVCEYVGATLKRSPWIERVDRVTKRADGLIRVHAAFRRPFTFIERDGVAYLIDEKGVLLPHQERVEDISHTDWLTIRGVRHPAPSQAGQLWEGEDVQRGIALIAFLNRNFAISPTPIRSRLVAVNVSNFDGKRWPAAGWLRLVSTYPKVYVHWGRTPGDEYPVEDSKEAKFAKMRTELAIRWLDEGSPLDLRAPGFLDRLEKGDPSGE
jgi:hypothetical protein